MDVYKYIAESNPIVAQGIIESFGYEHANTPDMGLSQVVAKVGEPALKKVMENHPDKELILEFFAEKQNAPISCGCGNRRQEGFLNASGLEVSKEKDNSSSNMIAQQTNAMILVSALFIFTALMIKK
jgi:hypothetical protein